MDIFVFGPLRDSDLMEAVAGPGVQTSVDAILQEFLVRPLKGTDLPFIEIGHGVAKGILWSGFRPDQLKRIELYQSAFGYRLSPVEVVADGEVHQASMHMPPMGCEAGKGDWFLTDWQKKHKKAALLVVKEIFAQDPLPDLATICKLIPQAEMRAWAKARAGQDRTAAQIRYAPAPEDFNIVSKAPALGEFFRLQAMDVTHRQFDGTMSPVLRREVFIGVDAALVLPYDPKTDLVLLVEQARMGPALRGDKNPWVLEPVAGMIDAGETPEEAAMRECQEEAGLTPASLKKINSFYPSPGSSTDYFHTFVGICKLKISKPYRGGLVNESEDLRLHTLPLEDALVLARKGEITAGPLMMMLYWIALHRDDLRAA